jgi:predicted nucleic acid-binding protein
LGRYAVIVSDIPEQFSYSRDPKDEAYINLALAARAPYLVTRDLDLLDLMKEDDVVGVAFRKQYPGLTIVDPPTFLGFFTPVSRPESSP